MDSGAGFALQRQSGVVQVGNDGAAAGTGKGDGSLYLGQHGTGSELVLADVLLRLGNAHLLQALLIGLAPVDGNTVHSGEDEQRIRVQQLRDLRNEINATFRARSRSEALRDSAEVQSIINSMQVK